MKYLRLLFLILACTVLTLGARAQTTNQTNTIVRFTVIQGTNALGTMDFELFDQDKPETVRNFLTYVQSGNYSNLVIHRCLPHFVLQAGSTRVSNPRSPFTFVQYFGPFNFGPITNEFDVGPHLSNTYGTIAMAKLGGDPNSASTDWFINLTNNNVTATNLTNLDEENGGYTVFGRILPDTNAVPATNVLTGTNILEHFNSLSFLAGLLNLELFYGPAGALFTDLPVASPGLFLPNYNDLDYVQIRVLNSGDTVRPTVVLKVPVLNQRVTNATHVASGTAADDRGVAAVYYRLNDGLKLAANGTTNWAATLLLPPGTNRVQVHSLDMAGNPSTVIQRLFFRVAREPLTVQTNGKGKTTSLTNGQMLEIGRGYKITATPAPRHVFAGWTGSITNDAPVLTFLMQSNMTLRANFIPNPFIPLKGAYNGLFYATNEVAPQRSGFFSATLTDPGRFTARLLLDGKTYPFGGQFNIEGKAGVYIVIPGVGPVYLVILQLDLTNGTQQITGTVMDQGGVAQLVADRATFHAVTNKATNFVGKYTLLIPGHDDPAVQPAGDGFGTATIDLAGNVLFSGALADGSPVTQRVPLARDGRWPLYASLYLGKGSVLGWITFTNRENDDLNGAVTWTKQPQPQLTAKYYRLGFTNTTDLIGSRYLPLGTNFLFAVTNAVSFSGGNLTTAFTNKIKLTPPAKVTALSTNNRLTLTITASSGLFNGMVTPPSALRPVPFKGALLQKQQGGAGFFLGTNQSGRVTVTAE